MVQEPGIGFEIVVHLIELLPPTRWRNLIVILFINLLEDRPQDGLVRLIQRFPLFPLRSRELFYDEDLFFGDLRCEQMFCLSFLAHSNHFPGYCWAIKLGQFQNPSTIRAIKLIY